MVRETETETASLRQTERESYAYMLRSYCPAVTSDHGRFAMEVKAYF